MTLVRASGIEPGQRRTARKPRVVIIVIYRSHAHHDRAVPRATRRSGSSLSNLHSHSPRISWLGRRVRGYGVTAPAQGC
jgi:hypothetical protein